MIKCGSCGLMNDEANTHCEKCGYNIKPDKEVLRRLDEYLKSKAEKDAAERKKFARIRKIMLWITVFLAVVFIACMLILLCFAHEAVSLMR